MEYENSYIAKEKRKSPVLWLFLANLISGLVASIPVTATTLVLEVMSGSAAVGMNTYWVTPFQLLVSNLITAPIVLAMGKRCYGNFAGSLKFYAANTLANICTTFISNPYNAILNGLLPESNDSTMFKTLLAAVPGLISFVLPLVFINLYDKWEKEKNLSFTCHIFTKRSAFFAAVASAGVSLATFGVSQIASQIMLNAADVNSTSASQSLIAILTPISNLIIELITAAIIFGVGYALSKSLYAALKFYCAHALAGVLSSIAFHLIRMLASIFFNYPATGAETLAHILNITSALVTLIFSAVYLLAIDKKLLSEKIEKAINSSEESIIEGSDTAEE